MRELSKEQTLALNILPLLDEEPTQVSHLAEKIECAEIPFLHKVIHKLEKSRLLETRQGKGGGVYRSSKAVQKPTVYDVFKALGARTPQKGSTGGYAAKFQRAHIAHLKQQYIPVKTNLGRGGSRAG